MLSPQNLAYDDTIVGRQYDVARAKQLLTEAGYPNGFKTRIIAQNIANRDVVIALQSYLGKVGIQCDIELAETSKYQSYTTGTWHNAIIFYSLLQWPNPNTGFNFYFGPTSPFFKSLKKPDNWSSLLNVSLTTPAINPLAARDCEQALFDDATVIPIFYSTKIWATTGNVHIPSLGKPGPTTYWDPQLARFSDSQSTFISISPQSGPVGTQVIVSGTGFAANETGISITFDGISIATNITADSQGKWTASFVVPHSGTGDHTIDAFGSITSASNVPDVIYTVNTTPFSGVSLSLEPATCTIGLGQALDLNIQAKSGNTEVDGIAVFIRFNPAVLEGVQITPGSSLPDLITNEIDNTNGLISYCTGKLGQPFPRGDFSVATIRFLPRALTPCTEISFSTSDPGAATEVDSWGYNVTGMLTGATIAVDEGAALDVSINLQGGSRPPEGWEMPLIVKFFNPGDVEPVDVLTAVPAYTFELTTARSGSNAVARLTGITPGIYDISIVSEHALTNVLRGIDLTSYVSLLNAGTLLEGDANKDHVIDIHDFGLLVGTFGKSSFDLGFDARADFDRNGRITIADFGLLATNYAKAAPIEIPRNPLLDMVCLIGDSKNIESPFANLKVRQAVSYVLDSAAIVNLAGSSFQVTNQPASPGSPYYNPKVVGYPYNVAKAKQLLAEAGYPNGFKTRLIAPDNFNYDVLVAIQSYLAGTGIQSDLVLLDLVQYDNLITGGWQNGLLVSSLMVNPYEAPDLLLKDSFSSYSNKYPAVIHPTDYQSKLEQAISEANPAIRLDLNKDLLQLVIDQRCMFHPLYIAKTP